MGEGAGDAGDDEVPDGVLQDGAVLLGDDVADVVGVGLAALAEGEVAEAAAGLRELLAADFRIGLPGHAVLFQKAVDLGAVDVLSADEVDLGLVDDLHGSASEASAACLTRCMIAPGWAGRKH